MCAKENRLFKSTYTRNCHEQLTVSSRAVEEFFFFSYISRPPYLFYVGTHVCICTKTMHVQNLGKV